MSPFLALNAKEGFHIAGKRGDLPAAEVNDQSWGPAIPLSLCLLIFMILDFWQRDQL